MKKITFTSTKEKATFEVIATLVSGGEPKNEKEKLALEAFEVDDYAKSEIIRAYQNGVVNGNDKTKIDGVKLYIDWKVI